MNVSIPMEDIIPGINILNSILNFFRYILRISDAVGADSPDDEDADLTEEQLQAKYAGKPYATTQAVKDEQ